MGYKEEAQQEAITQAAKNFSKLCEVLTKLVELGIEAVDMELEKARQSE